MGKLISWILAVTLLFSWSWSAYRLDSLPKYSSIRIYKKDSSPRLGKWRWSEDSIAPTDDKQVHAIGSFGLYYLLVHKGMDFKKAVIIVSSLGVAKECIDALIPWEMYGRLGGDGFSKYDLFYNSLGLFVAYTIDDRWEVSYSNGLVHIVYRP